MCPWNSFLWTWLVWPPLMQLNLPKEFHKSCETKEACANMHLQYAPTHSGVPRGGFGVFKLPPRNSEGPPKLCQTQPDLRELLKIAEFRTPTPQDVRKEGSKILKLPRFTIVLY